MLTSQALSDLREAVGSDFLLEPEPEDLLFYASDATFAGHLRTARRPLSGEHGIGALKRAFLREAVGEESLALIASIKQLFDPLGLLNPGKIFAPPGTSAIGFLQDMPVLDNSL